MKKTQDNRYYKDLKNDEKVKVLNEILQLKIDDDYKIFKTQAFIFNWLNVAQALKISAL